jgi:hypothetical protein
MAAAAVAHLHDDLVPEEDYFDQSPIFNSRNFPSEDVLLETPKANMMSTNDHAQTGWGRRRRYNYKKSVQRGCIKGVCQATPAAGIVAFAAMNFKGAAKYIWDKVRKGASTFTFASDTKAYATFEKVKQEMQGHPERFHKQQIFKSNDLGLLRLNGEGFRLCRNCYH